MEHFVTLFDRNFLVAGLCLYRSLERHAGPFTLWVLCMDEAVEARLRDLALPHLRLLPLAEVQTAALRSVRAARTVGEYCWTLTPFCAEFVMDREPQAARVTYLDADLCFFDDPRRLLRELEACGRHVLITAHAYSAEYDQSDSAGIYCVQFVTFRNTPQGREVMRWWQERCLEWCYNRVEDGKFGDQKYLDDWPQRFPHAVHVLLAQELALGPWNANRFVAEGKPPPVFFHFHGLRVLSERRLLLYSGYRLSRPVQRLYQRYVEDFTAALRECYRRWGAVPGAARRPALRERLERWRLALRGAIAYAEYRI